MGFDLASLGLLVLIAGLLTGLAWWQRKLSEIDREQTLAELERARELGTDRQAAQLPRVDGAACIGCGACITACPEEGVLSLIDGIARVVHASRCRGHATCVEACPVGALELGVGDAPPNPDLPRLSPRLESNLPGVFAAGELAGLSLIRNAVSQGVSAVNHIAQDRADDPLPCRPGEVDLLVVGAGPAGIAAGLRARELGLRVHLIDQDGIGGAVRHYPRRKLTLTGSVRLPLGLQMDRSEYRKEELIELWEGFLCQHQVSVQAPARLTALEGGVAGYLATMAGASTEPGGVEGGEATIATRRVLLALGCRGTPRRLGIPGEDHEKVLYRLVDAATYRNQSLLVVGGGDSAAEAAIALSAQRGNRVTLSYRRSSFHRLHPRNRQGLKEAASQGLQIVLNSTPLRVTDRSVQLRVQDEGGARELALPNDQVFVFAGGLPPRDLLRTLGVQLIADPVPLRQTDQEAPVPIGT